jgi:hypothetical protein
MDSMMRGCWRYTNCKYLADDYRRSFRRAVHPHCRDASVISNFHLKEESDIYAYLDGHANATAATAD